MPPTLEELEAEYQRSLQSSTSQAPTMSLADQLEADYQRSVRPENKIEAVAGQLGKGAGLGWFDEISGADKATRNLIASLFGAGNGKSWGETYRETVDTDRAQDAAFEAENPLGSMALQLGGSILPVVFSGGAGALARGATATQIPSGSGASLMRMLFGAPAGKSTVLKQVGTGVTAGGVAGAGEAREGERLQGMATGATIGAVAAPLIGKGVELATDGAASVVTRMAPDLFDGSRASQRGSISFDPAGGERNYTPADYVLAKQLQSHPIEKIIAAADEMSTAVDDGVPLFLPEALQSPKVDRNARFIANYDPSMNWSQAQISERTKAAPSRAIALFDAVSPEDSTFLGAEKMVKAADEIVEAAETRRGQLASPIYREAYNMMPVIESPALGELLEKDQVLQQAIASVKKTANNADFPDNSTELLVKARQEIGNLIEGSIAQGRGRKARDLTDTYNRLNSILHNENPTLARADLTYGEASNDLEDLTSTFLQSLRKLGPDKVQNIKQVFGLPPTRIADLREKFIDAGKLDEWNAGMRSYLQSAVEGTSDGRNFTDALVGNSIQRQKLEAALGDKFNDVIAGLNLEDRMFQGRNQYHTGSSSWGNFSEAQQFRENMGLMRRFANRDWAGVVERLFDGNISDDTAIELAQIYFDPAMGAERIRKMIPLVRKYARNEMIAQGLGKASGGAAARQAGLLDVLGSGETTAPATSRSTVPKQSQRDMPQELPRPIQPPGETGRSQQGSQQTTRPTGQSLRDQSGREMQSPDDPSFEPVSTQGRNPTNALMARMFAPSGTAMTALFEPGQEKRDDSVAYVEAQIDSDPYYSALYETESGRNPRAKNPESSAKGGFQFVNATAKAMGLKDPFDLSESFRAVQELTSQHDQQFGTSPAMRYAAHFLGASTLSKWINKKDLTAKERKHIDELLDKALPRFMRIYQSKTGTSAGEMI